MAEILVQGTPTSSLSFDYTPKHDDPSTLYFTGGAYATESSTIGYILFINDQNVGITSIYCNAPLTHVTLNPTLINYTFPIEIGSNGIVTPVKIRIEPINAQTKFDTNDNVILAIL